MSLTLSKETEQLVQSAVTARHLDTADTVITEAMELYQQREQYIEQELLEGLEDAEAGRLHSYNPALMEDIAQKALKKIALRKAQA